MSFRFEPVFYVKVIRRGQTVAERVDLASRVLSFSFEDHERKTDKLKLTVDNWDLANFDTPIWEKGNQLEVSWGYFGAMAPARRMVIKKVTGSTKLTIEAHSKAFLLDTIPRTECYENLTRSQIAAKIAERNGFGPELQDIEDTEVVIPSMSQARMTDAAFIRKLAQREWFEFFIDFDGFHFHKRKVGQAPLRELVWYDSAKGDILSFNITNDISGRIGGVKVQGRDPIKKKNFEVEIGAIEIEETLAPDPEVVGEIAFAGFAGVAAGNRSGSTHLTGPQLKAAGALAASVAGPVNPSALAAHGWTKKVVIKSTAEVSKPAAERKARGRVRKARQATIKMKIKIVGDPLLLAKSVIKLSGIGKRLSGNYYVKSHKHTLGGSGFSGELEVIRDGNNRKSVTAGRLLSFRPRRAAAAAAGATAEDLGPTNCAGWVGTLNDAVKRVQRNFPADRRVNTKSTSQFFDVLMDRISFRIKRIVAANGLIQLNAKRQPPYKLIHTAASEAAKQAKEAEKLSKGLGFRATIQALDAVKQTAFRTVNECQLESRSNFNAKPVGIDVIAASFATGLSPRFITGPEGDRTVFVNTGGRQ